MSLTSYTLTGTEALVRGICAAAFPSYSGRKFSLDVRETIDVRSSWEGGSRSSFVFVHLDTMRASSEVPAQSAFDRPIKGADAVRLPDGVACVEHVIFCGKDLGLRIHVNPQTVNPSLLPSGPAVDLSREERTVLAATAGLKAHARIAEAKADTGISEAQYVAARETLIGRKFLTAQGAITPAGRNAIGDLRLGDRSLCQDGYSRWGIQS